MTACAEEVYEGYDGGQYVQRRSMEDISAGIVCSRGDLTLPSESLRSSAVGLLKWEGRIAHKEQEVRDLPEDRYHGQLLRFM